MTSKKARNTMVDLQKKKELESLILGGFCPACKSVNLKYEEHEHNRVFGFKCKCCGWQATYWVQELRESSAYWSFGKSNNLGSLLKRKIPKFPPEAGK
jgi:Zn ribbon nucleic-acid-binding protein